jgi:hypothetical protein
VTVLSSITNSKISHPASKVIFFIFLIITIDNSLGLLLKWAYSKINAGPGRYNYIRSNQYDLLVMGSSTSTAYYSNIITKKTGLRTLNVGLDGSALIYSFCLLDLVIQGDVKPKMVILNIDLFELSKSAWGGNNFSMIEKLAPLYGETDIITNALEKGKISEKIKFFSKTYRYNDLLLSIPSQLYKSTKRYMRGASPNTVMQLPIDSQTINDRFPNIIDLDRDKLRLYEKFIELCQMHAIQPVFIESPIYYPALGLTERDRYFEEQLESLAKKNSVPFIKINQDNYPVFRSHLLYKDVLHLNHKGSQLFSDLVSQKLLAVNKYENNNK